MKLSRTEALVALDTKYHTGKPCKYGHVSPRYTLDGSCTRCRVDRWARHEAAIRQRFREARRQLLATQGRAQ